VTGIVPTGPAAEAGEPSDSRDRIVALSDGVVAIAITLLVLDIVPHIPDAVTGSQLVNELVAMAPRLVAYILSFVVIGRLWDYHRSFFRYIHRTDSRVIWVNLLALLWITLIPATAALLGSHWMEPVAVSLYAFNLILATASLWLLWRYVSSAGYVRHEELHVRTGQYIDRYVAITLVGYALAIPAAFLSTPVAFVIVFLSTVLARSIARQILAPGPSGHGRSDVDDEA
jgi:uncharacterized membrane protein